jgi:signal transduction histidine kinase
MDTRIIIVISGALFSIVVISFLFRFILLYQKRTNAFISERKVLEARYQQELLKAQLEMQEQTLKHISQEIHDNIGQTLSLAKLNLNRITDDVASGNVQQSTQLLTKAIADLRSLSRSLHADTVLSGGPDQSDSYRIEPPGEKWWLCHRPANSRRSPQSFTPT